MRSVPARARQPIMLKTITAVVTFYIAAVAVLWSAYDLHDWLFNQILHLPPLN